MQNVAVVVPTLNEERYITTCLRRLLPQLPQDGVLYVADGGSTDATVSLAAKFAEDDARVHVIHNERRTQAAAVNLVARIVRGRCNTMVRADAHADYPDDFFAQLIHHFRSHDAASVVVPMLAAGSTCFQKAAAAAQNSRLGNGGSSHRSLAAGSRFVDHGHHALFDLKTFEAVGGYDEAFRCNEDAELDVRIKLAGGSVWMCTEAPVTYYPRRDPVSLARQYFRHGFGRSQTLAKHGMKPRLRQQLPVFALVANVAALVAAPIALIALLVPGFYVAACLGWGIALAARARDACVAASGFAAMIMHMAWAAGAIAGSFRARAAGRQQNVAILADGRAG